MIKLICVSWIDTLFKIHKKFDEVWGGGAGSEKIANALFLGPIMVISIICF
jgi:hypothetical protein